MNRCSPLARALGLGAGRNGGHAWWWQRLTAAALLPLSLWLGGVIARLPDADHAQLIAWVAHPGNNLLLLSFIVLGFMHVLLGVQVVIEDYVHGLGLRVLILSCLRLVLGFTALAAVWACLRIAFGAWYG